MDIIYFKYAIAQEFRSLCFDEGKKFYVIFTRIKSFIKKFLQPDKLFKEVSYKNHSYYEYEQYEIKSYNNNTEDN